MIRGCPGKEKSPSSPQNTGTKGITPPWYHPHSRQAPRTHFPITEADPAAHFLTAAPGRTPHDRISRLSAGDRLSLSLAIAADFPVHRFLLKIIYTTFSDDWQGIFCAGQDFLQKGRAARKGPPSERVFYAAGSLMVWGAKPSAGTRPLPSSRYTFTVRPSAERPAKGTVMDRSHSSRSSPLL